MNILLKIICLTITKTEPIITECIYFYIDQKLVGTSWWSVMATQSTCIQVRSWSRPPSWPWLRASAGTASPSSTRYPPLSGSPSHFQKQVVWGTWHSNLNLHFLYTNSFRASIFTFDHKLFSSCLKLDPSQPGKPGPCEANYNLIQHSVENPRHLILLSKTGPLSIHQDNQGLVRLQELLHHSSAHQHNSRIVVKKLNFKDNDDNKLILKEVKQSGEIHIVLDCDYEKIRTVLKEAQVSQIPDLTFIWYLFDTDMNSNISTDPWNCTYISISLLLCCYMC